MNGFCLMLFPKDHKWDIPVVIMWIIGSSPYVDALVFINFPIILIFLNYLKNQNPKNAKSLYDYGKKLNEIPKRNISQNIHLFLPMIIASLLITIIFIFSFDFGFWFITINTLSTATIVPLFAFILILMPFLLISKSIREKVKNKFDCGIDELYNLLYDECKSIKMQKCNISDSNENLNNNNASNDQNSISPVQSEGEPNLSNQTQEFQSFSFEDFYTKKIEFNTKDEVEDIITIEKLFYFFSIREWLSIYIDQWNFYIRRIVYGEHYSKCRFKIIVKFICVISAIILQFVRIIYDGVFTFKKRIYSKIDIFYYIIRIIIRLFTIFFVAFDNVVSFYIDRKKIKTRYPKINISKVISIFIMAFMGFLMIISHILSKTLFERDFITSFYYNSTKTIQNINVTEKASICGINIGNFSIIQIAGLAMIATIQDKELQYNISKQIFDDDIIINTLNGSIISGLLVNKSNNYVVAYPGVMKKSHVGILFESIGFQYYSLIVSNIVTFYNYFQKLKEKILCLKLLPYVYSILLVGKDVTKIFINDLNEHIKYLDEQNITNPLFTGQMIGCLASKYLEVKWPTRLKSWAVSFESPSLFDSKIKQFAIKDKDQHNPLRLINIFSDSSIFSLQDGDATFNFEMPVYQSYDKPATSFETFCLIAAGCTETDRYDDIYRDLNSYTHKMYEDYFKKWKRIRK